MGIGQSIIDGRKTRGSRISQPCDLDGRADCAKRSGRPLSICMVRSTKMSIWSCRTVVATASSERPVISLRAVGERTQAKGCLVGTEDIGIAKDFDLAAIVRTEEGRGEKRLAMAAKVRRNIANTQSAGLACDRSRAAASCPRGGARIVRSTLDAPGKSDRYSSREQNAASRGSWRRPRDYLADAQGPRLKHTMASSHRT